MYVSYVMLFLLYDYLFFNISFGHLITSWRVIIIALKVDTLAAFWAVVHKIIAMSHE